MGFLNALSTFFGATLGICLGLGVVFALALIVGMVISK